MNSLSPELRDGGFDDNFLKLAGRVVNFKMHATPDGKHQARDVVLAYTSETDELVGTVNSFNDQTMYGFISCPSIESDVFFKLKFVPEQYKHTGNLAGRAALKGKVVRFCIATTPEGKPQANKVYFKYPNHSMGAPSPVPMMLMGNGMTSPMMQMGKGMGKVPSNHMVQQPVQGTSSGVVKSVNIQKDFGFIQSPQLPGADIYFKPVNGMSEGSPVSFALQYTPDGKARAANVQAGRGSKRAAPSGMVQVPMQKQARTTPGGASVSCTVISYNNTKGWGFLQGMGVVGDIYFMRKHLSPATQSQLQAGASLEGSSGTCEVAYLPDGRPQAVSVQLDIVL